MRQTTLEEFPPVNKTKVVRQMKLSEFGFVLIVVSSLVAGCTVDELIPDPPTEWDMIEGSFDTYNNSSIPTISIGTNASLIEVEGMYFNITTDSNDSFILSGYLYQSHNFTFSNGIAYDTGKVYLHFPFFDNVTYTYQVYYTEWNVE